MKCNHVSFENTPCDTTHSEVIEYNSKLFRVTLIDLLMDAHVPASVRGNLATSKNEHKVQTSSWELCNLLTLSAEYLG